LPAGLLREPLPNLQRAQAIVITRTNLVDEDRIGDLKAEILRFNPGAEIFGSQNKIVNLNELKDFQKESQYSVEKQSSYLAFCGLGNPENFFRQLKSEGFKVFSTQAFSDHYYYVQKDIDKLIKTAKEKGAKALITTAKDAVKLSEFNFELPCLVAESEMLFDREADLRSLIEKAGHEPAFSNVYKTK
jgi:tetraacyldisaccharide 4'-kinase